MKNFTILTVLLLTSLTSYSQWGLNGNPLATTNWLGSTNNQPINFRTNGVQRMNIMGQSPPGSFTGAFGLGTPLPLSYMHLTNISTIGSHFRTDGPDYFRSQWEFFTGASAGNTTRKFRVFTTQNGPLDFGTLQNNQHITLEASQRDMIFNAGGNIERMRILGQNHVLPGGIWGGATPLAGNIGIGNAHPLSKLQIGGNASANAGWRPWMQAGTLYASQGGLDNMYVGLKEIQNDSTEAIINWGNNPITQPTLSDRLRFIFTAAPGNGPASGVNGLQIAHMWANNNGDGRMAIGDFQTPGLDPQNTLEIRPSSGSPYWGATGGTSGLRFSFMNALHTPVANPGTGVLSVDENGDVIYVIDATGGGSGNGFTDCADSTGAANLLVDSKVNLNDFNLYFENNNVLGQNHTGFGYTCGTVIPAKLSAHHIHPLTVGVNTYAISGINSDIANQIVLSYSGVYRKSDGLQVPALRITNIGGDFEATGGAHNYGVRTRADNLSGGSVTQGVNALSDGGSISTGINATAINGSFLSVGGDFAGVNGSNFNYGVRATAGGGALNYGIYASTGPAPTDRAGYFVGIVEGTSGGIFSSDQMFKTDVQEIQNPLETLNQLEPKDYFLDTINFGQMNFTSKKQFGFIAQEVENVLPNLVHDSYFPNEYDSIGNVVNPGFSYKSMNSTGIVPVNTAAIKQLDRELQNRNLSDQSIKTNVIDLNNSLSKIIAMRGISYDWTQVGQTDFDLDGDNHIGFIAQELQLVDSRLTFMGRDSLLHVEYDKVVPILVEAIEELKDEVDSKDSIINDMNERLSHLENCLSGILPFLCNLSNSAIEANSPEQQKSIRTQLEVELSNRAGIILDQNVPNPFAEKTVINFTIPETVQKAQIHFYNMQGRIIQSVDLIERGQGSLTVFGSDLSSGTYTYTLVADGINVATKKMVKN